MPKLALAGLIALVTLACNDKRTGPSTRTTPPRSDAAGSPSGDAVPDAAPAPPSRDAATSADPGGAPCPTLDRAECLAARHCTLHHRASASYECLAASGPCEVDLLQGDKAACEQRAGCVWQPASCYCPFPGYGHTQVPDKDKNPGAACACGGGPPAMCQPGPSDR